MIHLATSYLLNFLSDISVELGSYSEIGNFVDSVRYFYLSQCSGNAIDNVILTLSL